MIEILAAIASVFVTALITYCVHIYRPKIGYEVQCASAKFVPSDKKIAHATAFPYQTIETGVIKLINPTRSDIENFEVVFEASLEATELKVKSSTSLAKNSVKWSVDESGLSISVTHFPAKEELILHYSEIGGRGLEYVSPKRSRGNFEFYSIERKRRDTNSLLEGLVLSLTVFGFIVFVLAILFYLVEGR